MNNNKPLTYIGLRTVLQHIDANLRFRLAAHMPSIRVAEKVAPLKLESLEYGPKFFSINKLTYMVTLYRKSRKGKTPPHIERNNIFGSGPTDIDRYGFRDESWKNIVLPGDIVLHDVIPAEHFVSRADEIDEEIRCIESESEASQLRLDALLEMAPFDEGAENPGNPNVNRKIFMEHFSLFKIGAYEEIRQEQLQNPDVERARKAAVSSLSGGINKLQDRLHALYDIRNNVEFDSYIQVIIARELNHVLDNYERIELVEYTAKLHLAYKSMFNFMFGNRKGVVYIKRLVPRTDQIMRMPLGLKIKIRELKVVTRPHLVYDRLKPIVDESSYPLEVATAWIPPEEDFLHPIIRSANKLVISGGGVIVMQNWQNIFLNLQNPRVETKNELEDFDIIMFIRNWVEVGRENGTCHTFGFCHENEIIELLKDIVDEFEGAVVEDDTVFIPLNNFSKIKFSYEAAPEFEEDRRFERWDFKMEVLPL